MTTTIKDILDDVLDDDLEDIPAAYATNTQPEYRRLIRYANKAVKDILSMHDWGALKRRGEIAVVDGTTLYDLPETYSHMIPDTARTRRFYANTFFPSSDPVVSMTDVYNHHIDVGRILGNQVELINFPEGTFYYMYVSKAAVVNNGVTPISGETGTSDQFLTDKDEWLLDAEMLARAIAWRWKKAEGAENWQVYLQDFNNYADTIKGRDTSARTFNTTGGTRNQHIPFWAKEIN